MLVMNLDDALHVGSPRSGELFGTLCKKVLEARGHRKDPVLARGRANVPVAVHDTRAGYIAHPTRLSGRVKELLDSIGLSAPYE